MQTGTDPIPWISLLKISFPCKCSETLKSHEKFGCCCKVFSPCLVLLSVVQEASAMNIGRGIHCGCRLTADQDCIVLHMWIFGQNLWIYVDSKFQDLHISGDRWVYDKELTSGQNMTGSSGLQSHLMRVVFRLIYSSQLWPEQSQWAYFNNLFTEAL